MRCWRWLAAAIGLSLLTPLDPPAAAQTASITQKMNAYIGCINRLSERSYQSRSRYFSWAAKSGPTGKERIIYGTYTIYDTSDCKRNVEKANAAEPRDAELEAAASAYVTAVVALEPLLKEADDYYDQQNYKDDKMAKGRALHPRLVAAWDAFENADNKLRAGIETIQDRMSLERLAAIEKAEGRKARWHVESMMISAKRLLREHGATPPNLGRIVDAVADFETIVKATDDYATANKDAKIGSIFMSSAKAYLTTAKQLMRRIRDKVPYSQGDKMMMSSGGGAWMVEGSPARLSRDYNELVNGYNRGSGI